MRASGRHMMKSTSVSGEIYGAEHADGSQSDTALGGLGPGAKKRRSSLSQRVVAILPSRRSRSTSQLSQTGQRSTASFWCFTGGCGRMATPTVFSQTVALKQMLLNVVVCCFFMSIAAHCCRCVVVVCVRVCLFVLFQRRLVRRWTGRKVTAALR